MANDKPCTGDAELIGENNFGGKGHGIYLGAEADECSVFGWSFCAGSARVSEDETLRFGGADIFGIKGMNIPRELTGKESLIGNQPALVLCWFRKHSADTAVGQTVFRHHQITEQHGLVKRNVRIKDADRAVDKEGTAVELAEGFGIGAVIDLIGQELMGQSMAEQGICGFTCPG